MSSPKADYRSIAAFYDKGRSLSRKNMALWLDLIARMAGVSEGARALDLGCGTGRFSLPMAERLGWNVTGADASADMLARARQKDEASRLNWVLADACALCFPASSFDVVFMSHLLHHVDSPPKVLEECRRVLAPSGVVLVRYGAMEQIRADVEHIFFPGVLDIDEARTPTVELTEKWLADAGFKGIYSEQICQQTYQSGEAHLEAARNRSTSVLSMIPEESFQRGIRRLADHVAKHPKDAWLLFDRMTITVGRR